MTGLCAATGFVVCALAAVLGILMIVRGTRRLRDLRLSDTLDPVQDNLCGPPDAPDCAEENNER